MRKTFNNLKIKTLGLALCVVLLAIGVGIVSASIMTTRDVDGIGQTWTKFDKVVAAKSAILGQMRGALGYGGMIHQFKNYVLRQDSPRIAKTQAKIDEAKAAMTAYRALGVNAKEDSALNDIAGVVALYADAVATAERMTGEGAGSTDIDKTVKISDKPALAGMATLDSELLLARQASSGAVYDAVASVASFSKIAVAVSFIVLIGVFFWFIALRLAKPLAAMTDAMTRLADGEDNVHIPTLNRTDEVGDMVKSVQVFKENAAEAQRLAAEQAEEEAKKAERGEKVNQLTEAFEGSSSAVLETVAAAADQMKSNATSMSSTAEETSRHSQAVSAASEEASTNVQTVASAAEEMSTSIEEIGRQVTKSTEISSRAVEEADKTNVSVESLAEAANKIGEVVNLISDIAEQTNLLALNATIEAARAGDAGKGFAVVASEVKSLADQTAKATGEIEAQINAMQSSTTSAVDAIKGIGSTIGEISEIASAIASAVEEQGAATQEISRNVQEAAKGTQEVTTNITSVNEAARDTGKSAAEVLEAAENMSKQSDDLRGEVEKFLAEVRTA